MPVSGAGVVCHIDNILINITFFKFYIIQSNISPVRVRNIVLGDDLHDEEMGARGGVRELGLLPDSFGAVLPAPDCARLE